jgi:Uncharacterized protein conserved in bacteria
MELNVSKYDRPVKQALINGWKRKCPNCGSGPMMDGYLAIRNECAFCSQAFHHQRADDGPAYITILISGHLLAPLMLIIFEWYRPDPLVLAVSFILVFITIALFLLPRVKVPSLVCSGLKDAWILIKSIFIWHRVFL